MGTGVVRLKLLTAHTLALALVGSLALTGASKVTQAAHAPVLAAADGVATQYQDATNLPLSALMGVGALVGGLLVAVALHGSGE